MKAQREKEELEVKLALRADAKNLNSKIEKYIIQFDKNFSDRLRNICADIDEQYFFSVFLSKRP